MIYNSDFIYKKIGFLNIYKKNLVFFTIVINLEIISKKYFINTKI